MESLHIQFEQSVKEKLLEFLNSFSKKELKIVEEELTFEDAKKRVQESYRKLKNGETKLYSMDEVDAFLEKTISKYEN